MEDTPNPAPRYTSETSKHREDILPFCQGYGLDIGFGGDPIHAAAIRMDFPAPYAHTGDFPVQLGGDCRNLKWLASDSLDYVYSSHVLEDFDRAETERVLREWLRVVKPGGLVVLLLPDQVRYIASCLRRGEVWPDGTVGNPHHSIPDFSLNYVMEVAHRIGGVEKHNSIDFLGEYSFLLVLKKILPCEESANKLAVLQQTLDQVYLERDALKLEARDNLRQLQSFQRKPMLAFLKNKLNRVLGKS